MYAIRYKPDTDLGRRFKGTSAPTADRAALERVRVSCANRDDMEIVEVDG